MILKELQHHFHTELDAIYGKGEVQSFFKLLIEFFLNFKPIDIVLHSERSISIADQHRFNAIIKRLKQEEPIQYIIGETEFFGLPFKVNPSTLIPRPETEELVQWIIENVSNYKYQAPNSNNKQQTTNNKHLTILDIGTGSGCIAIALAKNLPNAKVYAIDVSPEALKVAKENTLLNQVEVDFIEADILTACHAELVSASHKFDIIVSNPPYVRALEKSAIKNNVLMHEPHLALFVENDDPLLFYKAICEFAVHNLKPKGSLFFEINQYLGAEMKQLLSSFNFESVELQDILEMIACLNP